MVIVHISFYNGTIYKHCVHRPYPNYTSDVFIVYICLTFYLLVIVTSFMYRKVSSSRVYQLLHISLRIRSSSLSLFTFNLFINFFLIRDHYPS